MLVLGRHKNEDILIGDNITVKVLEIRGDLVRLGISAPIEVEVDRAEVRESKRRDQREAAENARLGRGGEGGAR